MLTGSCLCGGIHYQYAGDITEIALCHCQQCRKAQGSAFASNSPIDSRLFTFTQGEDLLQSYYSSPLKKRVFCQRCGSPLYSQRDDLPEIIRLRLGTLDSPISCQPSYHIYAASKAEWWTINDDKPQYSKLKPREN
ncbi:MAG TPA: GFA family protein [Agitococcus sp.]|nr:GFA family protein [Agitococcus sp.]HNA21282.1 GFA family protein [Agitococcus sp.]HNL79840.1 GFA family protein [Agitococcus sp.]